MVREALAEAHVHIVAEAAVPGREISEGGLFDASHRAAAEVALLRKPEEVCISISISISIYLSIYLSV